MASENHCERGGNRPRFVRNQGGSEGRVSGRRAAPPRQIRRNTRPARTNEPQAAGWREGSAGPPERAAVRLEDGSPGCNRNASRTDLLSRLRDRAYPDLIGG